LLSNQSTRRLVSHAQRTLFRIATQKGKCFMSSSSQSTHQATPLLLTRNRHYPIPFTCRFRKGANLIKRNQRKQCESLDQSMIISKNPTMKRLWSPIRLMHCQNIQMQPKRGQLIRLLFIHQLPQPLLLMIKKFSFNHILWWLQSPQFLYPTFFLAPNPHKTKN